MCLTKLIMSLILDYNIHFFAEALHNTNEAAKDLTDLLVAYFISWECRYLSQ